VPDGHKWCPGCETIKPHSEWHRNKRTHDGLVNHCKTCRKAEGRAHNLKSKYGLTVDQLEQMLAGQVGVCPICLSAKPQHVDHDHKTGKVRGVLCFACNAALGQFKDRPDAMRRAAAYVEGIVWKPTQLAPGVYRLPS
jgi:hypothetical protein